MAPADRWGDPELKTRIRDSTSGQHDAVVTWAVEGARGWYQAGLPPLPAVVDADTRAWRRATDRILGFWDQCLVGDQEACVFTTELFQSFCSWLNANGHHAWSKESFHPRFKGHEETARHGVQERRTTRLQGLSRPLTAEQRPAPSQPCVYVGVRFRTAEEIAGVTEEISRLADLADPSESSSHTHDGAGVPGGSARSATECCEGGSLSLCCQLCQQSPTYWRLKAEVSQ
jgi:phage/plasmid-associated DNA primase